MHRVIHVEENTQTGNGSLLEDRVIMGKCRSCSKSADKKQYKVNVGWASPWVSLLRQEVYFRVLSTILPCLSLASCHYLKSILVAIMAKKTPTPNLTLYG